MRSKAPASAQAAYRMGAAWPFDSTKRSLSGFFGSFGSKRISAKKSAAVSSDIDMPLVGWPRPASEVARTESIRCVVAIFFSAGMSEARSMFISVEILSYVAQQIAQREAV